MPTAGLPKARPVLRSSQGRVVYELMWLIQVGLLRREVDGQGITDRYRLAPLGRQLLQDLERDETFAGISASWADHLQNRLTRWRLLP
ncbi:hypothetical protein ACVWXW_002538 [Thermostichus sp. MS-CIW-30]